MKNDDIEIIELMAAKRKQTEETALERLKETHNLYQYGWDMFSAMATEHADTETLKILNKMKKSS